MESYHHLQKLPDKLYTIQNGKPRKLNEKQIQMILSGTDSLIKAINEGLYSFTEPMDSTYEIKDVNIYIIYFIYIILYFIFLYYYYYYYYLIIL